MEKAKSREQTKSLLSRRRDRGSRSVDENFSQSFASERRASGREADERGEGRAEIIEIGGAGRGVSDSQARTERRNGKAVTNGNHSAKC